MEEEKRNGWVANLDGFSGGAEKIRMRLLTFKGIEARLPPVDNRL